MDAAIAGLVARSTASGWVLCIFALAGVVQLGRILALQRPKMRELDIGENATIRAEFIAEMAALREEIKGLREENGALRREVHALHGVIDGMRRENLTAHLSGQRVVAEALAHSPEIERAIDSLKNVKGTDE